MGSHTIPYTLEAHESTHVSGGSDDIDSPLAMAAMANLTSNKIWKGDGSNRPAEVDVPAGKSIVAGSYTGDGTNGRQITTGFKCSMVIVQSDIVDGAIVRATMLQGFTCKDTSAAHDTDITTTSYIHASDGFVVSTSNSLNETDKTHYYFAISE